MKTKTSLVSERLSLLFFIIIIVFNLFSIDGRQLTENWQMKQEVYIRIASLNP